MTKNMIFLSITLDHIFGENARLYQGHLVFFCSHTTACDRDVLSVSNPHPLSAKIFPLHTPFIKS